MPLTPEDVQKKTFTPVRLREGYDMGEVDQFLDEVETELRRLLQDNEDLRTKLATAGGSTGSPPAQTSEAAEPPKVPALPVVTTAAEASSAATRLLEIATNNADQLVNEAKDEADKILGDARTTAETLESGAKSKAELVEADARTRSEKLDAETSERRHTLFGQLEQDKEALARSLQDLRDFEQEYRGRLKGYFEAHLKALDGDGNVTVPLTPLSEDETPRRLRELLGEDA